MGPWHRGMVGCRVSRSSSSSLTSVDTSYVGVLAFLAPDVPAIDQARGMGMLWLIATRRGSSIRWVFIVPRGTIPSSL
jgi:hypothetical protein